MLHVLAIETLSVCPNPPKPAAVVALAWRGFGARLERIRLQAYTCTLISYDTHAPLHAVLQHLWFANTS